MTRRALDLSFLYAGAIVGVWRGAPDWLDQAPFGQALVLAVATLSTALGSCLVWRAAELLARVPARLRRWSEETALAVAAGVAAYGIAVATLSAAAFEFVLQFGIARSVRVATPFSVAVGVAVGFLVREFLLRRRAAALRRNLGALAAAAVFVATAAFRVAYFELPPPARALFVAALVLAAWAVVRRPWPALASLALLLFAAALWPYPVRTADAERGAGRPDVLLVTIDTLRPDHLGAYGYERDTSPNLDALAARGVVFDQAVTPVPVTNPAHASLLTGLYPGHHSATTNGARMRGRVATLAGKLAELGYDTAAFTSSVVLDRRVSNLHRDFRFVDDRHPGWRGLPDAAFELVEFRLFKSFFPERASAPERTAEWTTRAALDWLATRDGPVFLWVHYYDPHGGYLPPEPWASTWAGGYDGPARGVDYYDLRFPQRRKVTSSRESIAYMVSQYDGEIAYTDHWAGTLFATIENRGEPIVAVTADHGESLDEHGYYFDHGDCLYDASLRIPWILRLPHDRAAGTRVGEQVRLIDIYPTLMELLGRQVVDEIDGRSALPLLDGKTDPPRDLWARIFRPTIDGDKNVMAKRTAAGHKLIYTSSYWADFVLVPPVVESFDLVADPGETSNLARPGDPGVQTALEALLRWHAENSPDSIDRSTLSDEQRRQLRSLGYTN